MSARTWIGVGLLPLRTGLGVVFAMHGWLKLTAMGMAGTAAFFAGLGIPMPGVMAPFITSLELCGGAALLLGLLTRPAALLLAADMVAAIVWAKLGHGFFAPRGLELELLLLCGTLTLAITGAGDLSLDALLARRRLSVPRPEPAQP